MRELGEIRQRVKDEGIVTYLSTVKSFNAILKMS